MNKQDQGGQNENDSGIELFLLADTTKINLTVLKLQKFLTILHFYFFQARLILVYFVTTYSNLTIATKNIR